MLLPMCYIGHSSPLLPRSSSIGTPFVHPHHLSPFSRLFSMCVRHVHSGYERSTICFRNFHSRSGVESGDSFPRDYRKKSSTANPIDIIHPEALGGIINRGVFWWLNSLLFNGSSKILRQEDLFPLDPELSAALL